MALVGVGCLVLTSKAESVIKVRPPHACILAVSNFKLFLGVHVLEIGFRITEMQEKANARLRNPASWLPLAAGGEFAQPSLRVSLHVCTL